MSPSRFKPRRHPLLTVSLEGCEDLEADAFPHGFSGELSRMARVGDRVQGTLTLHGHSFCFEGEVTFTQPGDPQLSLRGRTSVRFTAIPDGYFASLRTGT